MFFRYFERIKHKSIRWFLKHARGPHADLWLCFFSFAESSFFPITPDIFLVALLLARASRWYYYAFLTTVSSTLGGAFGYLIGALFFDFLGESIIVFYNLESEIAYVGELFETNAFLAIFAAAFTPIPYKVFTIAGGFFKIDFLIFILASVAGRGMRFFVIAYLMKRYGEAFKRLIIRYFDIFSLAVILLVILALIW